MRNLSWFQARVLGRQGRQVRRQAWHRWVVFTQYYLWFTHIPADPFADEPVDEAWHVVKQSEFTDREFLAHDWTDEPWDVPVDSGPHTCPAGYHYEPFYNACVSDSSGIWGSSSNGSDAPPPPPAGDNPAPIIPDEGAWQVPGNTPPGGTPIPPPPGGGPPAIVIIPPLNPVPPSGGENRDDPPPKAPPTAQVPAIGGSAVNLDEMKCYPVGYTGTCTILLEVDVRGGPAGVGAISVSGPGIGGTLTSTGWDGMAGAFRIPGVTVTPGSTITFTVTYSAPPLPPGTDYTGTVTYTFPGTCSVP